MGRIGLFVGSLACMFMLCSCTGWGNTSGEAARSMEVADQKVTKIGPEKLQSMLTDPELLIIDLRIAKHWKQSDKKILGAKRFDPHNAQSWAQDLDQDKKIVTYCA